MLMHCALLLSQYVVSRVLTMILSLILILILILIRILILWIMILMQHVSCILESFWNHVLYIYHALMLYAHFLYYIRMNRG